MTSYLDLPFQLFIIEGDFIHLREGAQKIVSANRAAAKFAAATAASIPSLPQSVVVTPVAQGHCLKRCQSTDGELQHDTNYHHLNDYISNVGQSKSDVSSQSKRSHEVNTFPSETQTRNSAHNRASNGMMVDRSGVTSLPSNNTRYQGR